MATHDLTGVEEAFRRLVLDLRRLGLRFALVGGLAVSARAEPRLTRDADVAVSVADDDHAEAVVRKMLELGYVPDVVLEQYVAGRLATVRFQGASRDAVGGTVAADAVRAAGEGAARRSTVTQP